MRFLYLDVADLLDHIVTSLFRMGHEVEVFSGFSFNIEHDHARLYELLDERIKRAEESNRPFDYVISFDFFYTVSDVCKKHGICYISWVYDSPQLELFHPSICNENNAVFIFDRGLIGHLKKLYNANIYHMPLAADTYGIAGLTISRTDEKNYSRDVSFVGGMYEVNTYNNTINAIDENGRKEIQNYLMENLCKWQVTRPWPEISDALVSFYSKDEKIKSLAYDMPLSEYYGMIVLSRKLAEMERLTILNRLSEKHLVTVYTNSKSPYLDSINGQVLPPVDYRTDMFKVFHLSKINLNITMPTIETGIPLRVFDIMSVGGFCLTNRQEEVEELFDIGKEIEVYHDLEELYEKSNYYLRHETERIRIAVNGYTAVKDRFSYDIMITKMLGIADGIRKGIR